MTRPIIALICLLPLALGACAGQSPFEDRSDQVRLKQAIPSK